MKAKTKVKLENIVFRIRQFNSEAMQDIADEIEDAIRSESEDIDG